MNAGFFQTDISSAKKQFAFRRIFLLTLFSFFISSVSFSQMVVTNVTSAQQLAQALVGPGIQISNITKTCSDSASGTFIATGSNLGMNSGIVLTSGSAHNTQGPNASSSITWALNPGDPGYGGDVDLTTLAQQQTYDACVLEFDLTTCSDTIKFNYSFGSDEYTTFVGAPGGGAGFNDIFAFLISGPGYAVPTNIAIVPGTTTPVSINNVNCLYPPNQAYYVCNEDPAVAFPPCPGPAGCTLSNAATTVEYDGFTTVLTAIAAVQPGQVYHLKLAVADALDHILDSGVFLEAGSLSGVGASIVALANYVDPTNNAVAAVEGCIDGQIQIQLNQPSITGTSIHFLIQGSATNGTDYSTIIDSMIFAAGDSVHILNIHPLVDGLNEGFETVILYLISPCTGLPVDSVVLYIMDNFDIKTSNDTAICVNTSAQLFTSIVPPTFTYSWSPTTNLSCVNCPNPIANPTITTSYVVTASWATCVASDTVNITVLGGVINAGPDLQLCIGDSIQLNVTGALAYSWNPATSLNNANIANPWCSSLVNITYVVTGDDGMGNCPDTDTMTVFVSPQLQGSAGTDTTICPGDHAPIWAAGASNYLWQPIYNIDNPISPNAVVSPMITTTYSVYMSNPAGCLDTESVVITVYPLPFIHVTNDTVVFLGDNLTLYASCGVTYQWSPSTFLDDANASHPLCTPTQTTQYTVTITTADGCTYTETVLVQVNSFAQLFAPNAFSPNGDGINDYFNYFVRGIFTFHQFCVYNRWGELVFATTDPTLFWDGKHNGVECEVGTYVYTVDGNDAQSLEIKIKGNLTLIR